MQSTKSQRWQIISEDILRIWNSSHESGLNTDLVFLLLFLINTEKKDSFAYHKLAKAENFRQVPRIWLFLDFEVPFFRQQHFFILCVLIRNFFACFICKLDYSHVKNLERIKTQMLKYGLSFIKSNVSTRLYLTHGYEGHNPLALCVCLWTQNHYFEIKGVKFLFSLICTVGERII